MSSPLHRGKNYKIQKWNDEDELDVVGMIKEVGEEMRIYRVNAIKFFNVEKKRVVVIMYEYDKNITN